MNPGDLVKVYVTGVTGWHWNTGVVFGPVNCPVSNGPPSQCAPCTGCDRPRINILMHNGSMVSKLADSPDVRPA